MYNLYFNIFNCLLIFFLIYSLRDCKRAKHPIPKPLNASVEINVNMIKGITLRGKDCTSKQKSCPRMLLCKGLMQTSSSILRSRASTALPGLSKDSWEQDSFNLGRPRDLQQQTEIAETQLLKIQPDQLVIITSSLPILIFQAPSLLATQYLQPQEN